MEHKVHEAGTKITVYSQQLFLCVRRVSVVFLAV